MTDKNYTWTPDAQGAVDGQRTSKELKVAEHTINMVCAGMGSQSERDAVWNYILGLQRDLYEAEKLIAVQQERIAHEPPADPEAYRLLNAALYYVPREREIHRYITAYLTRPTQPPSPEPHVIKQVEHALDDCRAQIDKGIADYIRGCISDYRHALTKGAAP